MKKETAYKHFLREVVYTFSEVYGPFPCEVLVEGGKKCGKESWAALMTKKERDKIITYDEVERPKHVLENGIGIVVCSDHGGV